MATEQKTAPGPKPKAPPTSAAAKKKDAAAPAEAKGGKAPKDKRSKAQIEADENAVATRRMLELWLKMKQFLLYAFGEKPVSDEVERQFIELATALQKQQRIVLRFMPKDIDFGSDDMVEIMRGAVSVQNLRGLPEADKQKFYTQWHKIYILLTRATGAMAFIAEGYKHESKVTQEVGLSAIKRGRAKQKEVPWYKNPSVITMIVVGAVVGGFLLYYLQGQ